MRPHLQTVTVMDQPFMKPLDAFPEAVAADLIAVMTDIDDTLTSDGQLPAASYAAMEELADEGLAVIAVTGRPAGWCDMIARFWPVAAVVGENGAFYFRYDPQSRRMIRRFEQSEAERAEGRAQLRELARTILAEVPGSAVASDQLYREADLAIDFSEDVPPLPDHAVERIVALFEEAGATAKVSSIHVNGWFGSYDKLSMTRRLVQDLFDSDLDAVRERIVFCGDSPNDAPMFAYFPHACGVANVRDFEGRISALPAYVAPARGAYGFVEIARTIIAARRRRKG